MANSRLKLHVSSDRLAALLSVAAGPALTTEQFAAELAAGGVASGIVVETYSRIAQGLAQAEFQCKDELIAVGHDPLPATDAWFELAFSEGLQAGHVREDGSVDYHDRELLKPVRRGDVIGTVHPPLDGSAGRRVDGTLVEAAAPRQLALRFLAGVELGEDQRVRATRDGVILYKAGQSLDVVDRHVHQGPVDLHSGNLNMQGSLVVKGDVCRPFSVTASGDVEILGNVDSAVVLAGGNLRVHGGIRGGDGGAVCAEGDLTLRHAESAEIYAGGALCLQESINSQLRAGEVQASSRVRGGTALAERRIVVKEAGASNGIDTELVAGEPLESPWAAAQRSIAAAKARRLSERVRGRGSARTKGGKSGRAKAEIEQAEIQHLRERAKRREALLQSASIQVTLAHPGVRIRIGDSHLTLDEPIRATRFSLDPETTALRREKASA